MDDEQAWLKYPQYRKYFNKLWVAEQQRFLCGPAGIKIPQTGWYISRPIYNIRGMGIGAEKVYLAQGDYSTVPPGHFWCQWFDGNHVSVTFDASNSDWKAISAYRGHRNSSNPLYRFDYWTRLDHEAIVWQIPDFLWEIEDVPRLNIEMINGNIIEVHLRDTPDPQFDEIIPAWSNQLEAGYYNNLTTTHKFIPDYDSGDGWISNPRVGFFVR